MAAPPAPPTDAAFCVLVPVKPPARGKTRLVGVSEQTRTELAAAFALDTVAACLGARRVAHVLVATDDARFSAALGGLGAHCIPDGASDLNATLRQTAAESARRWPSLRPVALCADLPALRAGDLDEALAQTSSAPASGAAFVADADGVGTTLYTAPVDVFAPRYGGPSRAAHLAAGATELDVPVPSLRRDVDDLLALRAALDLGLGAHTRPVVEGLGLF